MGERGERLYAIDWLRGIVMVLMALDHVRDYFGDIRLNPVDLATTTPELFFTRWITHFCAPVFVFLAGTSAWLYASRGRSRQELSRFLWTRGLWLIALEFTVVYLAWTSSFELRILFLQVIAAIGLAMVALAGLVFLSYRAIAVVGLALVLGHNLLDPLTPTDFGSLGWMWRILHEGSMGDFVFVPVGSVSIMVIYPILPWIGVMALGYAFGPLTRAERPERRATCLRLGLGLTLAFVLLRWTNLYGDPTPWVRQDSAAMTLVAFLNCQKYPPSLLYLLMTLGPSIALLAVLDREPRALGRALVVVGRVPLFYYVVHLVLIQLSSRVFYKLRYGEDYSTIVEAFGGNFPDWYGHPLWVVYLAWILIVLALYPLCRWYMGVKRRGRSPMWSYL